MKTMYRHGDLALSKIETLPEGLTKSKARVLLQTGSSAHPHAITKGEIYFKDVNEYVFGYLVAKDTTLTHPEHGEGKGKLRTAKIEDGIYELRRQQEKTHDGMRVIED